MTYLRIGSHGSDIEKWQTFLRGQDLDVGVVDGIFGPRTEAATREFQRIHRLQVDGVVGNQTIGQAMVLGLEQVPSLRSASDVTSPNFPEKPEFSPLSPSARASLFGHFDFVPDPRPGFPEGIRIIDDWERSNQEAVIVPQLVGVRGAPQSCSVRFHHLAAIQLRALFSDWEQENLLPLVQTWNGSFVPRFIRGSKSVLSNHAWGTAFDINAAWNPLGARPALVGQPGSVRKLVALANQHGFYWGGHFDGRTDGMHFECVKVM